MLWTSVRRGRSASRRLLTSSLERGRWKRYDALVTRRFRLARIALCVSVCWLAPSPLQAEQRLRVDIRLLTPGDADCIRPEALAAAVAKQEPPVIVDSEHPELVIDVRLARGNKGSTDGWAGVLRVSSADGNVWGERELDVAGTSCRSLDEELKFMIGLAAQGTLVAPPAAAPPPVAEVPPPVVPQKPAPPTPPRPKPAARWELALDTLLLGGLRLLPSLAAGAEVGAMLSGPFHAGARLSVNAYLPQEVVLAGDGRSQISYLSASGALCPLLTSGNVRADACVGMAWAQLGVASTGLESAASSRRSLLEGRLSSALLVQLMPRWWLGGYAELTVPLKRDRYLVSRAPFDSEVVFRLPVYSLAMGIGARVAL